VRPNIFEELVNFFHFKNTRDDSVRTDGDFMFNRLNEEFFIQNFGLAASFMYERFNEIP